MGCAGPVPVRAAAAALTACALLSCGSAVAAVPSTAGSIGGGPAAEARVAGRTLIWRDEFNGAAGALDPRRWTFAEGGGGWGNRELQCYTRSPKNAATNGRGQLVITALRTYGTVCAGGTRNRWSSARISTQGKLTARYGRLEIRAKLPSGAGAWPAFWALGANLPQVGWPRSGEIDVMEFTGNKPTTTTSAIHAARRDGTHWYSTRTAPRSTTLTSAFHTYAVEWTATSLTFLRDGVATGQIRKSEATRWATWPFDRPFFLVLNLAMGGTYAGSVPPYLTATQRFVVDYVRVYR